MNKATKKIVSTIGVIFGVGGFGHGFFETLQGNTPTGGLIVPAIGEAQRFWEHGSEYAFTFLPTFLLAGIVTMLISLVIIYWSLVRVDKKQGALIFLLLYILLFLVGGGIGQVIFFTNTFAFATRIHKPLTWWRKVLPEGIRPNLAKLWQPALVLSSIAILIALEIAIFGFVPGIQNADQIVVVMLSSLGLGLLLMLLAFVCGFAYDIIQKEA